MGQDIETTSQGKCLYRGEAFHPLRIGTLERNLPIVKIDEQTWIASFVMLGDVELVEHCADILVSRFKSSFDIIVVPEVKAIPLANSIARNVSRPSNYMDYCVIRKSRKVYFEKAISVPVKSITTRRPQRLYLCQEDIKKIKGKRVCLIDDVISTGGTIQACLELVKKADGIVHQIAVVLLEGNPHVEELEQHTTERLLYLERIPIYVAGG